MKKIVEKLCGTLIASCQALPPSPMATPEIMAAVALSAVNSGAKGIRACWPENIRAIKNVVDVPVIGINKVIPENQIMLPDRVYITPTFESAREIIEAGADILGMDLTPRGRSYDDIENLLHQIKDAYPDIVIMADISTVEEGIKAQQLGVDIVSTTLSGYTMQSMVKVENFEELLTEYKATGIIPETDPDYRIIRELKESIHIPINAEGRIWEKSQALKAFESGCDMLTIGNAISAPDLITNRFVKALKENGFI